MAAHADCQWYQSDKMVTASLKLGVVRSGDVSARFEENHCSVFVRGILHWECWLWGAVVPEQCRIVPGKVRTELRLKKRKSLTWPQYEIDFPSEANGPIQLGTVSNQPPPVPITSPQEELYVNHLPHDYYDLGGDVVKVKVQLSNLDKNHFSVSFSEQSVHIRFKSSDKKFLRMFEGSSVNTLFVWNIQLFAAIVPNSSSYTIRTHFLELLLKKTTPGRWKTLEASEQYHQITSVSNQNQESIIPLSNQVNSPISSDSSNAKPSIINHEETVTYQINNLNLNSDNKTATDRSNAEVKLSSTKLKKNFNFRANDDTITAHSTNMISPDSKKDRSNSKTDRSDSKIPNPQSQSSIIPNVDPITSGQVMCTCACCNSNVPPHPLDGMGSKVMYSVPPALLEVSNPLYRVKQLNKPSLTGLTNLGNSCFMSSVIQCLSNTKELRDFFVDGRYLADINKTNPLGFNGELAKCFSHVTRKLWSGEFESFPPKKLKSIISTRSDHFSGYQQADAHEFMSYLIDGLHEDLNRVKSKPQTTAVEAGDQPDVEVANECWEVHKKRNDSFLVEQFQGQFKSTLVCPTCNKVSVTFDPFMSLSVPIPRNLQLLPVIFVPCDPNTTPIKYTLKLSPDGNLELLKASVARKTGIPMTELRVFEAYNGKFQSLLSSNHPLNSIGDNDVIIVSEVLSRRAAGGHVTEINVIQRVQYPLFPIKCTTCGRLANQLGEGQRIMRCGQCKAVGYCNRQCQQKDWSSHKMICRHGRPVPVGLPFVVSLPSTQLTYGRLSAAVETLAKRSVKVSKRPSSANGGQENTEENPEQMYRLVPVDRYGDSKDSFQPLTDKGNDVLVIGSHFLAMDWQNDPKVNNSVIVTPKSALDHTMDPLCDGVKSVGDSDVSLEQCVQLFTEPELLTKEDAWYCSMCKDHREATKQLSVWRLPRTLILHLKRFSYSNMRWRDKITQLVTFPLRGLDMSSYMLGDAGKLISPEAPPIYDLYAIVNHYGAVHIGHYTAVVRPPCDEGVGNKDWLYYDDETVSPIPEEKVQTKGAYILFYVRRDCVKS